MANNEATVTLNADISKLQTEMQKASRIIKMANAEFKTAAAGMDKWSDNADGLQAKLTQLNKVLGAQRTQLDLLERELKDTIELNGENSAAADKVRLRIEAQKAAIANTEKQIRTYDNELKVVNGDLEDTGDEMQDVADKSNIATEGFTVMKGALASLVAEGFKMAISAAKEFASATIEAGMSFEDGMAKVAAISGATEDQLDALTAKAKEMGAKTKFSATESAEAFNYMAMAGWSVDDMLNGIEGIMNLAAASGSDLATTSDIVTDALTAMGYAAGDAGKLADVMAAASSNANTNVELMGKTFQYAAPIIGALGMNMEDAAVAIGLMANAGIKGEKSGTALRSILTRLSAPPKECADAMEELGISLTDSNGKMKSLDAVMQDMRKSFSNLSETQQTQYAKSIAGQEAMSGLLAIVNAAPSDFNKLTKAVEASTGSAESMADTMNDTVGGQMTLLKSQIEGVQIQIFEKLAPALRKGIDTISNYISSLDWDAVADKLGKFAENAVDFFVKIIKNGDLIIETLKSIAKVWGTLFVVKKVSDYAKAINGVIGAVKGMAAAMSATNATAGIFANLVSPGGAIVLGLAAIATTTYTLVKYFSQEKQAIDVLTDSQKQSIEASHQMKEAYDQMESSRQESMASVNAEYGKYQELASELETIVDENGKVKAGYEDRAAFITTTLNDALGLEMTLQDGIIENYQQERDSIAQLIEMKKAEAILQANESAYAEAIQKKTEATNTYVQAQHTFNDVLAKAEEQAVLAEQAYMEMAQIEANEGVDAAMKYQKAHQDVFDTYDQLQLEVYNTRQALQDATTAYEGYNTTIQNYEGLSSAIITGDSQKINDALLKTENGMKSATTTTADELKKQATQTQQNYELLRKAYESGDKTIQKQTVDDAKKLAELAKKEYENSAKDTVAGYANGLKDNTVYAEQAAKNMGYDSYQAFNESLGINSPSTKAYSSGEFFAQGFINGMDSKSSSVYQKALWLAKRAIQGLKDGQKEGSPSKITQQSGVFFTEGYMIGIASMSKKLVKEVQNMVAGAVDSVSDVSILKDVRNLGQEIMGSVSKPLSIQSVDSVKTGIYNPVKSVGTTKSIVNNYNMVQNNTSPKSLSALETYQARRQQIAMIKAIGV